MKISKIAFCLALAAMSMVACKKDEVKPNISGGWQGNWGFQNDVPSFYERWSLENGGLLNAYYPDASLYASGTWELNGDDFEAHYTTVGIAYQYIFTGTYDDSTKKITGDWRDGEDPSIGGKFVMYKQ